MHGIKKFAASAALVALSVVGLAACGGETPTPTTALPTATTAAVEAPTATTASAAPSTRRSAMNIWPDTSRAGGGGSTPGRWATTGKPTFALRRRYGSYTIEAAVTVRPSAFA